MRILWNEQENWFQAELGLNEFWKDDMELVRSVGFKTTGPPQWIWHTSKASILNKLRDRKPKSGLTITETALQKYNRLNEHEQTKLAVKKQFEQAKKIAAQEIDSSNWKDFIDEETGIVCKQVAPAAGEFKWKYTPPKPPQIYCFMCGDPLYYYELPDVCIYCEGR
jgi:hypothetical protein